MLAIPLGGIQIDLCVELDMNTRWAPGNECAIISIQLHECQPSDQESMAIVGGRLTGRIDLKHKKGSGITLKLRWKLDVSDWQEQITTRNLGGNFLIFSRMAGIARQRHWLNKEFVPLHTDLPH